MVGMTISIEIQCHPVCLSHATHLFQKHQKGDVAVDSSSEGAVACDQVEPPGGLAGAWLPASGVQGHHASRAVIGHDLPVAEAQETQSKSKTKINEQHMRLGK